MMMLANRTKLISPSFTIGISTKVVELNEQGRDIINLSVGEPDFKVPEKAKESIMEALKNNYTKYDKVPGLIELRRAISKKLKEENNVDYEPDQIVVSNGAKQAIVNVMLATANLGDEVLIPVPYWTSYPEIVKLCGGVPVIVYPEDTETYKISVKDLEKALTDKTKILFFNNPSNPSGIVYTKDEIEKIANFCLEHNIWIMSDEIYERFCFEEEYISIGTMGDEVKDITIIVNGLSKSASMTGLRIGYTASSREVAKAISAMQGHLTSHPATTSQWAAYTALTECRDQINAQREVYKKRRKLLLDRLDKMKDISYMNPAGAFYIMVNFGKYKDKIKYEGSFSMALSERLLEEANVAVVPGVAFGVDDYVRMSYAVNEESLGKALDRIEEFINKLS